MERVCKTLKVNQEQSFSQSDTIVFLSRFFLPSMLYTMLVIEKNWFWNKFRMQIRMAFVEQKVKQRSFYESDPILVFNFCLQSYARCWCQRNIIWRKKKKKKTLYAKRTEQKRDPNDGLGEKRLKLHNPGSKWQPNDERPCFAARFPPSIFLYQKISLAKVNIHVQQLGDWLPKKRRIDAGPPQQRFVGPKRDHKNRGDCFDGRVLVLRT